ncbi:MAG: GldG family protein [Verrucomicrobiota bacterium]|nr:GldG family protein [Verrucomicrobiota bacterium]
MKKETKFAVFLNSVGGALVILLCVIAFNIITAQLNFKADLTEGKMFTLSKGSKQLLDALAKEREGDPESSPLEIRFYVTRGEKGVPVVVNEHGSRVEDLLDQYKAYAGDNLELVKLNPRRYTEEEKLATNDGIQLLNNAFYIGLAVSYLDNPQVIPVLDPSRATNLEYDISRLIKLVLQTEEDRETVGVMSSLNVWGGPDPSNPMAALNRGQQQPPWIFLQQLQRDFNVERLEPGATDIPANVNVLMLIHPKNVSEATEYAIDQFVLRGGKLIAFVDPLAQRDDSGQQNPQMRIPGLGGGSNLNRLFAKWGVPFDNTQVVADYDYHLENPRDPMAQGRVQPAYLLLNSEALHPGEVVTRDLGAIRLPYAGSFDTANVATGLTVTELITSSEDAKLVDGMSSQFQGQQIMQSFYTGGEDGKPAGIRKHVLALKLRGKFTTAFPNGKPAAEEAGSSKPGATQPDSAAHLTESNEDNFVCLIGDTDILVDEHSILQRRFQISNNIAFVHNLVDHFGDETLINIRSRNQDRPFTTIVELTKEAQKKFEKTLSELQAKQQEILQKRTKLESVGEGGNQFKLSIDPEAIKEIQAQQLEIDNQIFDTNKELLAEIDWIKLKIKMANIGLMPLLVILFGIGFFIRKRKKTAAV